MKMQYHARMRGGQCSSRMLDQPSDQDDATELTASVGEGGRNLSGDVSAVQTRLNRVGPGDGGPIEPLAVDGICGPLTKGAIKRFQQRYYQELLGDGRIDPDKNTWNKLVTLSGGSDIFQPKASGAAAHATKVVIDDATRKL